MIHTTGSVWPKPKFKKGKGFWSVEFWHTPPWGSCWGGMSTSFSTAIGVTVRSAWENAQLYDGPFRR